ncbi:DUF732 domain-containing protein [Mycobacterium europaeum]|uniref:DUF732 domain-containing protein n=1 Tax=Mycobacterium europaeum TaxID=761804 RepID=UPI00130201A9|nr:DUF732 domain-containing protein [Mycobacterium europaeum]
MTRHAITLAAAVAVIALAGAPCARADNDEYLNYLQNESYLVSTHSSQQLLDEGYKVCSAVSQGATDQDAIRMVEQDLSVSSGAAISVYSAATVMLGC